MFQRIIGDFKEFSYSVSFFLRDPNELVLMLGRFVEREKLKYFNTGHVFIMAEILIGWYWLLLACGDALQLILHSHSQQKF